MGKIQNFYQNYLSLYKNVVLAYVSFKFFLGKLQTKYHFLGGGWEGGGDNLALGCIHTYIKSKIFKIRSENSFFS